VSQELYKQMKWGVTKFRHLQGLLPDRRALVVGDFLEGLGLEESAWGHGLGLSGGSKSQFPLVRQKIRSINLMGVNLMGSQFWKMLGRGRTVHGKHRAGGLTGEEG
jgi:hypothetical protein